MNNSGRSSVLCGERREARPRPATVRAQQWDSSAREQVPSLLTSQLALIGGLCSARSWPRPLKKLFSSTRGNFSLSLRANGWQPSHRDAVIAIRALGRTLIDIEKFFNYKLVEFEYTSRYIRCSRITMENKVSRLVHEP